PGSTASPSPSPRWPQASRAELDRLRYPRRLHHFVEDPGVLAHLPDALEAVVLEQLGGAGEQEPAVRLAARHRLGDGLHQAAAALGDLLQRAADRYAQDPLATVALVDEAAGSAPLRYGRRRLLVLNAVLDLGKLLDAPVLAPTLSLAFLIEHQRRVRPVGEDAVLLRLAVIDAALTALRAEPDAP